MAKPTMTTTSPSTANSANSMETSPNLSVSVHSVATHPVNNAHGEGDNLLQAIASAQKKHAIEDMKADDKSIPAEANVNETALSRPKAPSLNKGNAPDLIN
ncbi:MAG: hypothetical protein J3R72DRAFT_425759 [Linnemannia gamsii]|nr:MAG: hypothetical protein J3R72DRAFT_425759 [Linnemannia gamsii]